MSNFLLYTRGMVKFSVNFIEKNFKIICESLKNIPLGSMLSACFLIFGIFRGAKENRWILKRKEKNVATQGVQEDTTFWLLTLFCLLYKAYQIHIVASESLAIPPGIRNLFGGILNLRNCGNVCQIFYYIEGVRSNFLLTLLKKTLKWFVSH